VRIIIECPERILHLEAGYIYANRPSSTSTLLRSGGGPYIATVPKPLLEIIFCHQLHLAVIQSCRRDRPEGAR
jgi:hypothetical protein